MRCNLDSTLITLLKRGWVEVTRRFEWSVGAAATKIRQRQAITNAAQRIHIGPELALASFRPRPPPSCPATDFVKPRQLSAALSTVTIILSFVPPPICLRLFHLTTVSILLSIVLFRPAPVVPISPFPSILSHFPSQLASCRQSLTNRSER